MTEKQIAEQIEAIKSATAKAMVSKEAALDFLERAGILPLLPNYKPGKLSSATKKKNV
jgi:hypothetical protein